MVCCFYTFPTKKSLFRVLLAYEDSAKMISYFFMEGSFMFAFFLIFQTFLYNESSSGHSLCGPSY